MKNWKFIKLNQKEQFKQAICVTLSRPEVHNAFNEILIEEITQVFKKLSIEKHDFRTIILMSEGTSFSAGADLNWMKNMINYSKEQNEKDANLLFDMFNSISNCSIPVIARVHGSSFGGGIGLIAASDMAFGINKLNIRFGLTEVKLGLVPAVISPFVIQKIGFSNCSRYFLTGEQFNAEEAKRIGLLQDYFNSEEDLDSTISKICNEISNNGPEAIKICKELLKKVVPNNSLPLQQTKEYVASTIAKVRVSLEGQSGINAFLNKQKPPWITKN